MKATWRETRFPAKPGEGRCLFLYEGSPGGRGEGCLCRLEGGSPGPSLGRSAPPPPLLTPSFPAG